VDNEPKTAYEKYKAELEDSLKEITHKKADALAPLAYQIAVAITERWLLRCDLFDQVKKQPVQQFFSFSKQEDGSVALHVLDPLIKIFEKAVERDPWDIPIRKLHGGHVMCPKCWKPTLGFLYDSKTKAPIWSHAGCRNCRLIIDLGTMRPVKPEGGKQ
jgi:hypothetical protein